jgi:hypothetical protein
MRNSILRDALLSNPKTAALVQAKAAADAAEYRARLARYNELKGLVKDAFPKRRDVVFHAIRRPEHGSSRLWDIAGDVNETAKCEDLLKWAGTSEKAEIEAKLFVNPSVK